MTQLQPPRRRSLTAQPYLSTSPLSDSLVRLPPYNGIPKRFRQARLLCDCLDRTTS